MKSDFRKLEQRIKSGESFAANGMITESNIFLALEMKKKYITNESEILDIITQLDRKTSKLSVATRVLAIAKTFTPHALTQYCFVEDNLKNKTIREDSPIVTYLCDQLINRIGFEGFVFRICDVITDYNYLATYMIEHYEDNLIWMTENVDYAGNDSNTLMLNGSVSVAMQAILDRYDIYLNTEQ